MSTPAPLDTPTPQLPDFDLEGHRGARGLMPENTVPAMLKALALGVTTLEMDTHITRDGKVILSHDPYINHEHSLGPAGEHIPQEEAQKYVLYQMDYEQVSRFDVGSKYYAKFPHQEKLQVSKPLLADVIDAAQAYLQAHRLPQVFYNIETKSKPATDGRYHPGPEEFVKKVMDVVRQKNICPWVIIQSFDVRTLQLVQQQYPQVKTSLLVENRQSPEANLEELAFRPTIYSPDYRLVTPKLVQKCHRLGMKLIPWTVNNLQQMRQLKAGGVDGLISDYPNLFSDL